MSAAVPSVSKNEAPYNLQIGKDRFDHCKAKNLIYGGEARPDTPKREGKKSVTHGTGSATPYATYAAAPEEEALKEHHTITKKTDTTGKIGVNKDFNPDVYLVNLKANLATSQSSRLKSFVGNGNILAQPKAE